MNPLLFLGGAGMKALPAIDRALRFGGIDKPSGPVGDLRGFKRGHFVQDGAGALQQRPGQHGAGAFAQAQAQIEQRLGVQALQHERVAALLRVVGEYAVGARVRHEFAGRQRGSNGIRPARPQRAYFSGFSPDGAPFTPLPSV